MLRKVLVGSSLFVACYVSACDSDEPDANGAGGASAGRAGGAPSGGRGPVPVGGAGSGEGGIEGREEDGGAAGGAVEEPASGGDGGSTGGSSPSAGSGGASGGESGQPAEGGVGGEGAVCVPTTPAEEVCDDVDNDCNGEVDDIDAGGDGIRDCLSIKLVGSPGANASSNFQSWLEEQGVSVTRTHMDGAPQALTSAELEGVDVLILDQLNRAYTEDEAGVLAAWVEGGGGLMSLNGHTGSADRAYGNSLLLELGVEYVAGLRSDTVDTFAAHPLTTGLTSVTFSGGYAVVDVPERVGSGVTAFIAGPDLETSFGLALERGRGRAFIWGDEWVEFDSEWSQSEQIKQFWVNALGWLSGAL